MSWFSSDYKIAFETGFCTDVENFGNVAEICYRMTGLLKKEKHRIDNTIDWTVIFYNYTTTALDKSDEYKRYVVNTSKIDFPKDFEPFLAFEFVEHYICFIQQRERKGLYNPRYRCYKFDGKTGEAIDVTMSLLWAIGQEATKNGIKGFTNFEWTDSRKLIAIYNDFHLYKEKKVITYCPSHTFFFRLGCIEDTKALIDCSHL